MKGVGSRGGGLVSSICLNVQSHSFGNRGLHAKLHNPSTTPTGRRVKFNPKYIIVGMRGGGRGVFSEFVKECNLILLVTENGKIWVGFSLFLFLFLLQLGNKVHSQVWLGMGV
jgi:hypothetical protein